MECDSPMNEISNSLRANKLNECWKISLETNQQGEKLEKVEYRVSTPVWVIAKFLYDNAFENVTTRDLRYLLSEQSTSAFYEHINKAMEKGIIKKLKNGLYKVNKSKVLYVLHLIPFDAKKRFMNIGQAKQWREALNIAKLWNNLLKFANKQVKNSDGTTPRGSKFLPFIIDKIQTPSGQTVVVYIMGNMYIILEGLTENKELLCADIPNGKLCSTNPVILAKYMKKTEHQNNNNGDSNNDFMHNVITISKDSKNKIIFSMETDLNQLLKETNIKRVHLKQINYDNMLLFDNIRFIDPNGKLIQDPLTQEGNKKRLKTLREVVALGDSLRYAEIDIPVSNPTLYHYAKLMSIFTYTSKVKDSPNVIRIEARPRAKVIKKFGLPRVILLFISYLYELGKIYIALATSYMESLKTMALT